MADIEAHGYTLSFGQKELTLTPSLLRASLGGNAVVVPYAQITAVEVVRTPTTASDGVARLAGTGHEVSFAPGQQALLAAAVEAITAALQGEIPEDITPTIEGLSFVAFDVETANPTAGSVIQIGAVRVIDGRVDDTWSTLVKPHPSLAEFDPGFQQIHGLSEEDVATAPTLAQITPELCEFVGDLPLVAHNAHFDMTAMATAWKAHGLPAPAWQYACSLAAARHFGLKLANYKLPTVAGYLDVPAFEHHDALADARASAEILLRLARRGGHTGSLAEVFAALGFELGYLDGYRPHPVARVSRVAKAPAPKKNRWAATATPEIIPEPNPDADPAGPLFGQVVVLSGEFTPYDKGELWNLMAARGAQVAKNVTKKTTLLIAGAWQTKTSKHKRAEELIAAGQAIDIWEPAALYAAVGLPEPQES